MEFIESIFQISRSIFVVTIIIDIALLLVSAKVFISGKHTWFVVTSVSLLLWKISLWISLFAEINAQIVQTATWISFASAPALVMLIIITYHQEFSQKLGQRKLLYSAVPILLLVGIYLVNTFSSDIVVVGDTANEFLVQHSLSLDLFYALFIPISGIFLYVIYDIKQSLASKNVEQYRIALVALGFAFVISNLGGIWLPWLLKSVSAIKTDTLDFFFAIGSIETLSASAITIWGLLMTFAIIRYRMFDVRFIIKQKHIAQLIILILIVVVCLVSLYLYIITNLYAVKIIVMVVGVIGIIRFREMLHTKYLLQSQYDLSLPPVLELTDMTAKGVDQVVGDVNRTLQEHLSLDFVTMYIYDWHDKLFQKYIRDNHGVAEAIQADHPLLQVLSSNKLASVVAVPSVTETLVQKVAKQYIRKQGSHVALALKGNGVVCAILLYSAPSGTSQAQLLERCLEPINVKKLITVSQNYGYYVERLLTYQAIEEQMAEERGSK